MSANTRLINSILNPPAPMSREAYAGYYYAFFGNGGFSLDQSFNPILVNDISNNPPPLNVNFHLYDVTYAIQVKFDVRKFNKKLGLLKDASNLTITDTSFNFSTMTFPNDTINITANEFINGMSASQVISVGEYKTLYSEYIQSVNKYFLNSPSSTDTLLSSESSYDISNGVFDAYSFMDLITQTIDVSNQRVNQLNGFITLSNINQLLQYSVKNNVFGNRTPLSGDNSHNFFDISYSNGTVADLSNNTVTTTVIDISNNNITITIVDNSNNVTTTIIADTSNNTSVVTTTGINYSAITTDGSFSNVIKPSYADVSFSQVPANHNINEGFLAGDLIFIPSGISTTLELVIDPMVDANGLSIVDIIKNSGLAYEYAIDLSNITTHKTTIISKILVAPLLIELTNLS